MSASDWRVIRVDLDPQGRIKKRILSKYDPASDELVFCEEWFEDNAIQQAQLERELPLFGQAKNIKPLAVIPDSVMSRAINEGWVNDQKKWAQWAKDIDNRKVQV